MIWPPRMREFYEPLFSETLPPLSEVLVIPENFPLEEIPGSFLLTQTDVPTAPQVANLFFFSVES